MRPVKLAPFEQGHFDGLCGIYAVINAVQHSLQTAAPLPSRRSSLKALTEREADLLFLRLIDGVVLTSANAVVDGVGPKHLWALLRVAQTWVREHRSVVVKVSRLFRRTADARPKIVMSRIATWVKKPGTAVIVGADPPWGHWTVAARVTPSRLHLLDSGGRDWVPLKPGRTKCFHAGLIRPAHVYVVTIERPNGAPTART